jgi:hypothetical protein
MQAFVKLLQEFGAVLSKYNPGAYKNLAPPLQDAEIEKNLRELNIKDENAKTLYLWKGGVQKEGGYLMMPFGELLTFGTIKEIIQGNDIYDSLLKPLISDNGEEIVLFNTKQGKHYGQLYLFSVPSLYLTHPIRCFDSLYSMIETTVEAYKENIYQFGKESKRLRIDWDKLTNLANKYNPKSTLWTNHNPLQWEDWYEI